MICEAIDGAPVLTARLVCEGCGCTDDNACPGGCYWVSRDPPVCSACVDPGELADADVPDDLADGISFGGQRCPASPVPSLHIPLWTSDTEGYCARCRIGFAR
jgi:hypothetical protein